MPAYLFCSPFEQVSISLRSTPEQRRKNFFSTGVGNCVASFAPTRVVRTEVQDIATIKEIVKDLDLDGLQVVVSIVSLRMVLHHNQSRNLLVLMQLVTRHLRQLTSESRRVAPHLTNWLFLSRVFLKHVMETQKSDRIAQILEWDHPGERERMKG